jgi:hypothetical protein
MRVLIILALGLGLAGCAKRVREANAGTPDVAVYAFVQQGAACSIAADAV